MKEFEIEDGVLIEYHEIKGKTSVIIPNNVTRIDDHAFDECKNLTNINIPNSVTSIGAFAFEWCENLKSLNIPNSIIQIEGYAFYECESLTNINIPNSVTQIGYGAFCGCVNLTSINIPDNVLDIEYATFWDCTNLINVKASEQTFEKFKYDDQYLVVSNFARQYYSNNIYTEEEKNRYKNFITIAKKKFLLLKNNLIKENIMNMYSSKSREEIIREYIISIIQNKPLLQFMFDEMDNVFTASELIELIRLSVEIHETEITAFLMDYKERHFGHENPLDNDDLNLPNYSKEELEEIKEKEKIKKKTNKKKRKS